MSRGDRAGARQLEVRLVGILAVLGGWALLDRSDAGSNVLLEAGTDTLLLRRVAAGEVAAAGEPDWGGVRAALDSELQGSLYLLAVLTDDLFATHADLWLWAAQPGPARPRRIRVPLDDSAALEAIGLRLEQPVELEVPWLGARFADSAAAAGPLVVSLTAGGPAEKAGIALADVVRSIAGRPVDSALALRRAVAESAGAPVELEVETAGSTRSVTLTPGSSPQSITLSDPDLLDPAVAAALAGEESREESATPRWLLDLNRALLHMRAGEWRQAVRVLREVEAPAGPGLGQAAVDYWLGVALMEADPAAYEETARGLFARASEVEGARLQHHDGPLLVTLARARVEGQSP